MTFRSLVVFCVLPMALEVPRPAFGGDRVSTLEVSRRARDKGLKEHRLEHYCGVLLMQGMAELAVASGDADDLRAAREALLPYATGKSTIGGNFVSYRCGGNGAAFLLMHGHLPEGRERIFAAAKETLFSSPRSSEGIVLARAHSTADRVFIDTAFPVTPFQLWTALALNEETLDDGVSLRNRLIDDAWQQIRKLHEILWDPKVNLYHQGRGFQGKGVVSTDHWSRGNGWAALSWAAVIRSLPKNDPRRPEAERLFRQFMQSVVRHQDSNGMWRQEMTIFEPHSYPETSGTGLLLYAMATGIEQKALDESYRDSLSRGLQGYLKYIEADGSVRNTCRGTLCPEDGTPAAYCRRAWVRNDPHAFGPVVLAFSQAYRCGVEWVNVTDDATARGYDWEKELDWRIRMNRGPKDAWGDLPTALRLLDRAQVSDGDKCFYTLAYKTLVARPEASFADLSQNAEFRAVCSKQQRGCLGGPMLGNLHPHGADIWVRTLTPAEVAVLVTVDGEMRSYGPVRSNFEADLSVVVPVDGLSPSTTYSYQVLVDDVAIPMPEGGKLTTAPTPLAKGKTRIAFGGDFHRWGFAHKPLFDQILRRDPTAMVLVGDIAVSDRFTHRGLHQADYLLRDLFPLWRQLVARVPVYTTWDDHDYLDNDLGGRPPRVTRQQQVEVWDVFRDSWNNPGYGFPNDRRGVFFRTRIGPVDLIMVDNKFFREKAQQHKPPTLLGADQMSWLEQQLLDCEGPFIILSCGTMWTDHVSGGKDSWGKFASADRERLFRLFDENRIGGVLLISGDRHGACGYRIPRPSGFNLHEFNVGSLGGIRGDSAPAGTAPEADGNLFYRYGEGYAFGEFTFDTTTNDPTVTFRLIQDDGKIVHEQTLAQSQLTPRRGG